MTWKVPEPGMTTDQWQAGRCAGCGFRSALIRDHDHATGLERGLLCRSCNTAEGQSTVIGLWTRWRSGWNPATLLGDEREYDGGWAWQQKQLLEAMYPEPTMDELRAAINRLGGDTQ
jgi:hypothetical protein